MLRVQAWERLNNPEYCGQMNTDQFYRTFIEAGYSEEVAEKAAKQRASDRLDAGMVV